MAIRVLVHIPSEDSILADLDQLPDPKDNFVTLLNCRRKDGKPISYLADGVTTMLYAWSKMSFIEILEHEGHSVTSSHLKTEAGGTTVLGFFREDAE